MIPSHYVTDVPLECSTHRQVPQLKALAAAAAACAKGKDVGTSILKLN